VIARDRTLDHLSEEFKPKAFEILARFAEHGIAVCLVETLRSAEAHAEDIANGRSWVAHSKHQDGNAIDVAPFRQYLLHGSNKLQWDASDPVWEAIGAAGKRVEGVNWGGDWAKKDLGHFELA
jgi:hypothetical protein